MITNQYNKNVFSNTEAEQMLLGMLLCDNSMFKIIENRLKTEYFSSASFGHIYEAITKSIHKLGEADPITIKQFGCEDDDMSGIVDILYKVAPHTQTAENYADIIRECWQRRTSIQMLKDSESDINDYSQTVNDVFSRLDSKRCLLLRDNNGNGVSVKTSADAVIKTLVEIQNGSRDILGVTTGIPSMDKKLGGLNPSNLIIIGARPAMGKTGLALNIAYNAAAAKLEGKNEGANVLIFSMEMTAEELAKRLLCTIAGVSMEVLKHGVKKPDLQKLEAASAIISDLPLLIDDTPGLSFSELRGRSLLQRLNGDIGLIVIDYLQLIKHERKVGDNRTNELTEITKGLKGLAKELNIPIIALSQLSRYVEQREDKRPQLSDLRESGSIEQDADLVLSIYREEYYLAQKQPTDAYDLKKTTDWYSKMKNCENVAEVAILKNRHGSIGTFKLKFNADLVQFTDRVLD